MKITNRTDLGPRIVDGATYEITRLVWQDGGLSYEVHDADGQDLTADGCFDATPTDDDLRSLPLSRRSCPQTPDN
ncbi:hypothetical protein AB0B66_10650 [Catellatospora sp. NPDC049111]|uniref:hypothetical protein n=1 Tax=Catellatospora sp. NPDC049111 TaxID=3155271 RepID=UPI00340CCB2C